MWATGRLVSARAFQSVATSTCTAASVADAQTDGAVFGQFGHEVEPVLLDAEGQVVLGALAGAGGALDVLVKVGGVEVRVQREGADEALTAGGNLVLLMPMRYWDAGREVR
jgi:hypothetical protein